MDYERGNYQINEMDEQRSASFVESDPDSDDLMDFSGTPGPLQYGANGEGESFSQFPDLT